MSRGRMGVLCGLAAALVLGGWVPSTAQAQVDYLATSSHHLRLESGRSLRYEVDAGRVPIRGAGADEIRAEMFFVAYRVPTPGRARPVTFLWNGGPGANSSWLHLNSIGPVHLDGGQVVDFPQTALATTDLVFVDAVGTGFSRPTRPAFGPEFYQTRGDVAAFTEFVRAWRLLFGATDAPLFVGGESWGSYRAVAVADDLGRHGVPVAGALLLSGRLGLGDVEDDLTYNALRIVQLPAIARHFGKLSPSLGSDLDAVERQARAWALGPYLSALRRIHTLDGAERDAIAGRLALYSGLPPDRTDRATLLIPPSQYLKDLLKAEGKVLQTNDMTQTETTAPPGASATTETYLRRTLGYRSDLSYLGGRGEPDNRDGYAPLGDVTPSASAQWDYVQGFYAKPLPPDDTKAANAVAIARGDPPGGQDIPLAKWAMAANPKLRLLVINGRYDSLRSCASTEEILHSQDAALRARISFRCYPGGHMFYLDPQTRKRFSADLQGFITGGLTP